MLRIMSNIMYKYRLKRTLDAAAEPRRACRSRKCVAFQRSEAAGGARGRLLPRLGRAVPADDCCRAWGGRCPRTIAAALGHIEIESGSDSISYLFRDRTLYPIYRKSSRIATRFAMFLRFENAAGGARRRLLPRLVGTILNREAIQNLCWFVAAVCTQFTANRVERRLDLLCLVILRMRRAVPADDCCRAWSGRF